MAEVKLISTLDTTDTISSADQIVINKKVSEGYSTNIIAPADFGSQIGTYLTIPYYSNTGGPISGVVTVQGSESSLTLSPDGGIISTQSSSGTSSSFVAKTGDQTEVSFDYEGNGFFNGNVTATYFIGDGSQLQGIGVTNPITYKGTIDCRLENAPSNPLAGDLYINLVAGDALPSWDGLTVVAQNQFISYTSGNVWTAGAILDGTTFVTLSTDQTVTGVKTFASNVTIGSSSTGVSLNAIGNGESTIYSTNHTDNGYVFVGADADTNYNATITNEGAAYFLSSATVGANTGRTNGTSFGAGFGVINYGDIDNDPDDFKSIYINYNDGGIAIGESNDSTTQNIYLNSDGTAGFSSDVFAGGTSSSDAACQLNANGRIVGEGDSAYLNIGRTNVSPGTVEPLIIAYADGVQEFKVGTDGSGEFAGAVTCGEADVASTTVEGVVLRGNGIVDAQRLASSSSATFRVWKGDQNTISLNADGSGTFRGDILTQADDSVPGYVQSYAAGYLTIGNAADFGQVFGLYDTTNSKFVTSLSMDGSATFGSYLQVNSNAMTGDYNTYINAPIVDDYFIASKAPGDLSTSPILWGVKEDGSATFSGNVFSGDPSGSYIQLDKTGVLSVISSNTSGNVIQYGRPSEVPLFIVNTDGDANFGGNSFYTSDTNLQITDSEGAKFTLNSPGNRTFSLFVNSAGNFNIVDESAGGENRMTVNGTDSITTFPKTVVVGNNPSGAQNVGVVTSFEGYVQVTGAPTATIWYGYEQGTNVVTSRIYSNGDATFDGKLTAAETESTDSSDTVATKGYVDAAGGSTDSSALWRLFNTTLRPVDLSNDCSVYADFYVQDGNTADFQVKNGEYTAVNSQLRVGPSGSNTGANAGSTFTPGVIDLSQPTSVSLDTKVFKASRGAGGNTIAMDISGNATFDGTVTSSNITNIQNALTAIKTAAQDSNTDLAGLKSAIATALANF